MRRLFLFALLAACGTSHEMSPDAGDAGAHRDAGPIAHPVDAAIAPPMDGGGVFQRDSAAVMPAPGVVTCGARTCADGQACCVLTLQCFDPRDASACAVPSGTTDPGACASNADCGAGELCEVNDIFSSGQLAGPACGGTIGHCVRERPPGECGGFADGVCGCDGRTYADPCAASRAGVRVSWYFPCGHGASGHIPFVCSADHTDCPTSYHCDLGTERCVSDTPMVACGIDAQCPTGYSCCGIVGLCMRTSCPECCTVPPAGTSFPCVQDSDCDPLAAAQGPGPSEYFCGIGNGCGTPGGCTHWQGPCGGAFMPVCGCDGVSYSNVCWAQMARIRVAHDGECP